MATLQAMNLGKEKVLKIVFVAMFILIQFLLKQWFSPEPKYNWDAIPYMSLVLRLDGWTDDGLIHEAVYKELKNEIPEHHFKELTTEPYHTYRIGVYSDPKSLAEQQPFYAVKPLFISMCYAFYKSGFGLFKSTTLPAKWSYYLLGLVLFFFLSSRLGWGMAFLIGTLFHLLPSTLEVSSMSTPDSLSALFFLLAIVFLLKVKDNIRSPLFFMIATLIRPENMLYIAAIYGLILIVYRDDLKLRWIGITTVVVTGLLYWSIMTWAHYPGWKALFSHSFENKMIYPVSDPHFVTWTSFWSTWSVLYKLIATKHIIYVLFGSLVIPGIYWTIPKDNRAFFQLPLLLFVAVSGVYLLKFFLMPEIHDRLLYLFYVMMIVLTVELVSKIRNLISDNRYQN